jgi:hypothetical protein
MNILVAIIMGVILFMPSAIAVDPAPINPGDNGLTMIVTAIGLAVIIILISNSLAPEHVFFKLILLFFSFGMMYILSDTVHVVYTGYTLERTSNMLFYTITWLYRIFVGYIFIYTMYASAKWLGWFNGLRGWFKR